MNGKLNNTTWRHIQKDDPRDRLVVEVGDSKVVDKFFPQIKIGRWGDTEQDNECNYSVRLIDNELDIPQIITEDNKIKYIKSKLEAHFYEKENAYEFEVLLKQKPLTNKVRFTLQDKDVEYFYQPPMTEEKLKEGQTADETHIYNKDGKIVAERPENIVGSYAVYTKTPKINWKGGKLYKAGKVGHIYRPKITDAKGNWTWGELNIFNGILTITINQTWLDNAVYPVKIDPTFGYDTIGSSAVDVEGAEGDHNYIMGSWFSASENGTVDKITFYLRAGQNEKGETSIYKKSDASRLAASDEVTFSDSTAHWQDFSVSGSPAIDAEDYFLFIWLADNSGDDYYYYDSETGKGGDQSGLTYPNWPDNYNINSRDCKFSIYCTYTAGGETTSISVSDSGSGTEAVSVKSQVGIAETGQGQDSLSQLKNLLSVQDTGQGNDILSQVKALLGIQDDGQGADTGMIDRGFEKITVSTGETVKQVQDSGVGIEAISLLVKIALSDTATGQDAIGALIKLAISDSGVGSEVVSILSQILQTDTGSGTEALNILAQIAITDTASGADALEVLAQLAITDTGLATEALEVLRQIAISDLGTSAEALNILRKIAISDSGTSTDALTVLVKLAINEVGTGADAISINGQVKFIQDTGSGTDALSVLISTAVADAGIGSEVVNILNQLIIQDSGQGTDVLKVLVKLALTDTGTGIEAIQALTTLAIQDTGVGSEVLQILAKIIISDTALGNEALKTASVIALTDTATGQEAIKVLEQIVLQDSGIGIEEVSIKTLIIIKEAGIGIESVILPVYYSKIIKGDTSYSKIIKGDTSYSKIIKGDTSYSKIIK